jgi:peroxiredoxin
VENARLGKRGEIYAGAIAAIVGCLLVYAFASAISDGQRRTTEVAIRGILNVDDETWEDMLDGETTPMNYVGNDRLAPDFELLDKDGRPWRLSDHRGKVVVMNFWSITCQPCVEEMPQLVDLASIVKDRDDVEVVAISVDEGWDAVGTMFERDSRLKVLFDPDRAVVLGKFGTRMYPETWFVDPDGVIRLRVDGPRDWSQPLVLELIESFKRG